MGKIIEEFNEMPNFGLSISAFFLIITTGFAYLYVAKPNIETQIDVVVCVFATSGFVSLFLFFRSLKNGTKKEKPRGC